MTEKKQLIDYTLNERLEVYVLLKAVDLRVTGQGKNYLSLLVADRSGEIRGMKWETTQSEFEGLISGSVVKLVAIRQDYQGKPQLKVLEIRETNSGEPQDPSDFIRSAPIKKEEMEEEVSAIIFQIINPNWNRIVRYLFKKYHDAFYQFPAAKSNHHAFPGGLAYHTLSIVRLAQSVVKQYDDIDASLLYAGALLHDLGKTIELSGPIATTYTTAGNLIGHITLIDEQIVLASQELSLDLYGEDMLLLRHVVLAHHGLLEYGSPVQPLVKEANILHQLDELDASLQSFDTILNETPKGSFSQRAWSLDNRSIYNPKKE